MLEKVINILTKRKKKEAKKKEKKNYHYCKLLAGQDTVFRARATHHRAHREHREEL